MGAAPWQLYCLYCKHFYVTRNTNYLCHCSKPIPWKQGGNVIVYGQKHCNACNDVTTQHSRLLIYLWKKPSHLSDLDLRFRSDPTKYLICKFFTALLGYEIYTVTERYVFERLWCCSIFWGLLSFIIVCNNRINVYKMYKIINS